MDQPTIAPRPRTLGSTTNRAPTTLGMAFITITVDEVGSPFEAFVNVGKADSDTFAVAEAMGRLVSLILRMPSPLTRRERAAHIVAQLSRVGSALQPVLALPDALAVALAEQIQLNADASTAATATESRPPTRPTQAANQIKSRVGKRASRPEKTQFLQSLRTNSDEGASQVTQLKPKLKQAAQSLGQALKNTPPLRAYAEASARLEADDEATGLLDELQRVQADIRTRQSNGGLSREDLARLRQLQNGVQSNPTIADFMEAQQIATLYLPEVNLEISKLLGVDFATLGRVNTC